MSAKQQTLILALLTEPSQRQACETAGIPESSLYRWMRQPAFRAALDRARQRFADESVSQLARRQADRLQPA